MKKDVADYKPVIDRLNKTGSSLVQLVSPDAAQDIQDKLDDDNKRVDNVRTGVRERSNSIDAAMQQSAEVWQGFSCCSVVKFGFLHLAETHLLDNITTYICLYERLFESCHVFSLFFSCLVLVLVCAYVCRCIFYIFLFSIFAEIKCE